VDGKAGPLTRQALLGDKYTAITGKRLTTGAKTEAEVYYPGDRADEIKVIQQKLKDLEYYTYSNITGYYGPITEDAVRRFQSVNRLTVDGIVQGDTLKLLQSGNAKYFVLYPGDKGDLVVELQKRLNSSMPEGIRVTGGTALPEHIKSAMAIVTHARYNIRLVIEGVDAQTLNAAIEGFLKQEQISVMKEQPKKEFKLKEIDIRPMIITMELIDSKDDEYYLECLLTSGSKANLKPELLVVALKEYTGYNIEGVRIVREEVYAEKNGSLFDLLEYEKQ
jgi:radical SAM-linked protein